MWAFYLNTDLCLSSKENLSPLAAALEGVALVMYCSEGNGTWYAAIEADGSGLQGRTPEEDIAALISAVRGLTGIAAGLWQRCDKREFNVGWQSTKIGQGALSLGSNILADIARVGGSLVVTIYPSSMNDSEE